jgi:dinuclear metal center YbgI/SA1388 family protein
VGLLVGDPQMEVTGVLVTLDTLEGVLEEAREKDCNLVVSFHPILFQGLKRITGATYVERVVARAIGQRIAIYSMHTALDNVRGGVNRKLCEVLGLVRPRILLPRKGTIKKLVTYVPQEARQALLAKLFQAGAGELGNYTHCSFSNPGEGSFLPGPQASPAIGERGRLRLEPEQQLHLTFTAEREKAILQALQENHPYEEVAYEISTLDNAYQHLGMGMVGELEGPMEERAFLERLKQRLHTPCIRHSPLTGKPVRRVAVLGGSGAFAIGAARACGADVLVTADVKYHQFFQAESQLVIADVGHYESEQFTKNLLAEYLTKKITNFAPAQPKGGVILSKNSTNPINYF